MSALSKMAIDENRRFPRYPAMVVVDFTNRGAQSTGLTQDISAQGMFVRTSRPPRAGDFIHMTLRFPGRELPIQGVVVRRYVAPRLDRSAPSGFGLAVRNGEEYRRFVASVATSR